MQMATTRPDFISYILKHNDEKGMTRREIESNASIIISAGSETTATVLAACVFYLLKNPDCQERLTKEIREVFPTDESVSFQETSKLPFLNAVIEESLHLHPPAPAIGPKLVPRGGAIINGQYVPGEVIRLHWTRKEDLLIVDPRFRSRWHTIRHSEHPPTSPSRTPSCQNAG
jgi:cytochrome P450